MAANDKKAKDTEYTVQHGQLLVKGERRMKGQTIKASELEPKVIEQLVREGLIESADAPLTVRNVNAHVVDHLLELMQTLGIVVQDGQKFTVAGEKVYVGKDVLRDAITVVEAKDLIAAAFGSKSAAISELTRKAAIATDNE